MNTFRRMAICASSAALVASSGVALAADDDWVAKSNQHVSETLFPIMAKYGPEGAGSMGIDGLDEEIFPIGPEIFDESMAEFQAVIEELEQRLEAETDSKVRQDLQILVQGGRDSIRSSELNRSYSMPYFNPTGTVFFGMRSILDPQNDTSRYPSAVVRLRKYAGLVDGYEPMTENAKAVFYARMEENPDLAGPFRGQVEQDLQRAEQFLAGIPELFTSMEVQGWEEPWAVLEEQLRGYNDWVTEEILPRSREDFRMPRELYEDALYNWGVYWTPEELMERAAHAVSDIQAEMTALAPLVAREHLWDPGLSYQEVIRKLQEDQIPGDQMVDAYTDTLHEIEDILRANAVISIPERPAGIRVGSEAETAAQPAPHLDIPRMVGNTGEYPFFVLPLSVANEDGSWPSTDDGFYANTWTLTAHEARPGHEMQFSSMIEGGVSTTRVVFAFNSANVEGWALYAEAITKPYMPLDGQLISLQNRLVRAYRMLLDPMLNLGLIEPEVAKKALMDGTAIMDGWAQNEIERYTYRIPGQATAYYYGYSHLQSMRAKVEIALGENFDQKEFHDFILAQGLLPPDVLETTIMDEFVPMYSQ